MEIYQHFLPFVCNFAYIHIFTKHSLPNITQFMLFKVIYATLVCAFSYEKSEKV